MNFTRTAPRLRQIPSLVHVTSAMPLPGLLAQLTAEARPRLTWYSGVERIELSGQVLDNWVTKVANFLVEEYEAGPGTRVSLDLPVHWRSVVWAFAVWRVGACLTASRTGRIHLVVSDRPAERAAEADTPVVALGLPALARAFDGPLPEGVVDATGSVMGYGDVLTWMPEPDPLAPAIDLDGRSVLHRALPEWATGSLGVTDAVEQRARVLVEPADPRGDLLASLGAAVAVYGANGSLLIHEPITDDAKRAHLVATERVTRSLALGNG